MLPVQRKCKEKRSIDITGFVFQKVYNKPNNSVLFL